MEIFDNVSRIVRDDLTETIKPHSRTRLISATSVNSLLQDAAMPLYDKWPKHV